MIDPQTGKSPILSRSLSGISSLLVPIAPGFKRLVIEATWRHASSTFQTSVTMQFSSSGLGVGAIDTGTNYNTQKMTTSGAILAPANAVGVVNAVAGTPTGSGATAGLMGSALVEIHNTVGANKMFSVTDLMPDTGTIALTSGYWKNTGEINQIYLVNPTGNWNTDSWIRILGEH